MADSLVNDKGNLPKDLQIVQQPQTDKDYYNFKATGLSINTPYYIKFQWVYEDGTVSNWSSGYFIQTSNESAPAVPTGVVVPETSVGSIPVELSSYPQNAKRVDVYISGGIFGTSKIAYSFTTAGKTTIAAPAGEYIVQLRSVSPSGVTSTVGTTFTITISDSGEVVQAPTNPNGFSIDRILGGIQVNWAGTYSNGTFTGFEAIKIYVGNSATATSGTYKEAGVMTGNNVINTITIPVDGTYLRYNQPVYVHARAVNKDGVEGTLQQNVATNALGARSAVASDLADNIITNAKLVDDAVTAAKIATNAITEIKIDQNAITAAKIAAGAITETKIASDAITAPKIAAGAIEAGKIAAGAITAEKIAANAIEADKIAANAVTAAKIVANAITADKIVSSAITADKIATNAITATKIQAGEIDVTKLSAGTISVNNLESGTLKTTSYIRVGSKDLAAGTGSRVEMSSALIEDGTKDILAGFYIYNSNGDAILSAPLGGGLSITGSGTFTGNLAIGISPNIFKAEPETGIWLGGDGTYANSNFRVSTSGILRAKAGAIGDWQINEQALKSSAVAFPNIELDPVSPKIELRETADNVSETTTNENNRFVKIDTVSGLRIGKGTSPAFKVDMDGGLTATNATISRSSGTNIIQLSSTGFKAIGPVVTTTIAFDGSISAYEPTNTYYDMTIDSPKISAENDLMGTYIGPGFMGIATKSSGLYGTKANTFQIKNNLTTVQFLASTGWSNISWVDDSNNGFYNSYGVTGIAFRWRNTQTAAYYNSLPVQGYLSQYRSLGLTNTGAMVLGPRMFTGSATTSAGINTELGGSGEHYSYNGDLYFSTA